MRRVVGARPRLPQSQDFPDEEERPRQSERNDDGYEEVERLFVVILVRDEAREVVLDEKLLDERPAVARDDRRVPHARDRERKRRAPDDAEPHRPRPLAPQKVIKQNNARRDDDADQSLRKQRRADERVEADEIQAPP